MQNAQPKGFLFGDMAYFTEESVENLITNMDKSTVPYLISQAITYAHSKNVFNLTESEIISKCLRILNKEIYSYDSTRQDANNVQDNKTGDGELKTNL